MTGHTNWVYALTLLPNGLLASGSMDTTIKIWNITKTSPLYTLPAQTSGSGIRVLVLINEDYLASGALDGTIKLWSLKTNFTQVRSWQAGVIVSMAYDSTLNVLASGENTPTFYVKVWDSELWANSG